MKTKNHDTKNLDIKTRIAIAALAGISLAVVLIILFMIALNFFLPDLYNFSDVDTSNYSTLNTIQWNETVEYLADELSSKDSEEKKYDYVQRTAQDIKKVKADLYIEKNGEIYFTSDNQNDIKKDAHDIITFDNSQNINYFGDNGLVILNHMNVQNDDYLILIQSKDYTVENINTNTSNGKSIIFSRTGLLFLIIFLILLLSIILMSVIVAKTITKPMDMLITGVNEISNGNLDYKINYDSTNEIGTTVKAVNTLAARLSKSIEERNEADEQRKQMLAGIAHDLRTPLTSVKGYLEGLRDGIANTPEKQQQYLQTIYSSTLDMEKLLDELQTISRLERKHITLEKEPINLHEFLLDYIEETRLTTNRNNYTLEYVEPNEKDKQITVMLDADRFSRVLMNVISNAVKYSSKARDGKMIITLSGYKKSAVISMKDNGIGISKENLPHIFETFFRADQARTRVSDGSGIGLAVCKEIVELHNGHIWASSVEGEGTTIFISLNRIIQEDNNE